MMNMMMMHDPDDDDMTRLSKALYHVKLNGSFFALQNVYRRLLALYPSDVQLKTGCEDNDYEYDDA